MNVRWKVTLLIAALFVVLGAVELLIEKSILMPSFAALEHEHARVAMRRIDFALEVSSDRLARSAADWGNWIDTYQFVQDRNRNYIDANLTPVSLKELNVNAMLFIDLDGNVVLSNQIDLDSDRPLNLDFAALKALPADFPWRANLGTGRAATGFLQTNRGIMLIAASPILNGSGKGSWRGLVILGRLLTPSEIRAIGSQVQSSVIMTPYHRPGAPGQLVETDSVTKVYRLCSDVYGRPIMMLRVDVPREITYRGHSAVAYASAYLLGAAVVVLVLLVIVLNRVVLNPLARMTRHALAIGEGKDLTARLDFDRADEIGVLAREFDRMVQRLAESRAEVIDQSFQAGFAELAKGVLHNIGNAMTPIGVRLSALHTRLRTAPTQDTEMAIAELASARADDPRRADLEEFLRLAGKELAHIIRGAEGDIAVTLRQTAIVQTALSEQLRSTRNEHVIEAVRLPELIAQALEIVPDASRQRLAIEADVSLSKVGVLRIARTVVRLILQNLIINAADSIRDAQKTKGVLRIAAEMVREADSECLHLICRDDGSGISQDHLERIFDKGFSTKSSETNYGIGLHWCANAIGALGGRIWAASDGPGAGACMHLMVPLSTRLETPVAAAA
jgi:two-component system, NtrC family, sensor kinase